MEKTKIIVDTASDITIKEAEDLNIELIPINITIGSKTYREQFDISKREFWSILNDSTELPKTAQITPLALLDSYKKVYSEGYTHIIVVTINAKGSGTYNNAVLAVDLFNDEVKNNGVVFEIIDSATYTYCYGRPVMLAAQMLLDGKSFLETVKFLKNRLSHTHAYAYISTLKYAKLSGRISIVTAIVGEALGLKPILSIGNGRVDVFNKVRGEKTAISKIIEHIKNDAVNIEKEEIILVYGDVEPEIIHKIRREIKEKLKPKNIFEGELGCCITNNTGPNTVGILFQGKDYKIYK